MKTYDVVKPIPGGQPPVAFVERPWGFFKQYAHNSDGTVSLMTVRPTASARQTPYPAMIFFDISP